MEIGSEFIINKTNNNRTGLPLFLTKYSNLKFTSSGRGAIALVLESIKPKKRKVLLPIYICESVISTFKFYGYEICFYDLADNFVPKTLDYSDIGVFFHMGYFGFDTNKSLSKEINLMKSSSIIVIEDVTHSMLSESDTFYESDYYIGSLRKWIGIPSGGFAAGSQSLNQLSEEQTEFVNIRKKSFELKKKYFLTKNKSLKIKYLNKFSEAEKILDKDIKGYLIDTESLNIVKNTNFLEISSVRRKNFQYLLDNFKETPNIEIVFKELQDNITPLFFLIKVKINRDLLRSFLSKENIYCPIHWPIIEDVAKEVRKSKFENVYHEILSIPCDQRYNLEDMERILRVISLWEV
ncbi:DegT/DnrJ/EryC1/StrS family aminotransferase [Vagococcus carniphilus]|uniref:DegT/DnrJ/EryC1/StrS family aminotransferase n=1 Tax=Vagococcus carniphilus TaxID=218144 RepID=UPI002892033B|nr:DegT/DnrJ/EryC1/StrS family aminotransferase [Vagococcus carniphilus]MDT2865750.1 DegT/DnrJ/EryC1/StrS family aminotransferase [Vagococcus carniphilus]